MNWYKKAQSVIRTWRYWMTPGAELLPTPRHLIGARVILGLPSKPLSVGGEAEDREYDRVCKKLFSMGYLRISETDKNIYATGNVSDVQLPKLKDWSIEKRKILTYNGVEYNPLDGETRRLF